MGQKISIKVKMLNWWLKHTKNKKKKKKTKNKKQKNKTKQQGLLVIQHKSQLNVM